ncbi:MULTISPECIES: ACP S-malonyltransferase [Fusobacterium]|uniref:Malonyl CoA-acyl carrier protein transacylase n=1 Tax=Fusobacterium hominis TaxID=2764326 RepID=A0A7G9GUN8_9FUSO|nr:MULTISPECIES: ACP S-malonyltransferase [Fusobacterium]QNM14520.1 ACP S-malonyltransferase [Fusobacterium hominis]
MAKVAFVFPGQGAQYVGMGKELYENNEIARKEFDSLFSKLDFDLKTVMFEGPEEALKETKNTQPAIVSMSLVLTKLLEEKGIKPDFVAGHSVGEYAAFGAAGYLSIEDAVKLTAARGKFMNDVAQKVNGGMAAIIGLESDKIVEVLKTVDGVVEAVNFNEPKQTVIAGQKDAIEKACVALKEAGARRAMPLAVSGPFHSSLMKEAGEKLKEEANNYDFKMTDVKLIANTTADILTSVEDIKEEIYAQSFGPVKWVDTVKKMKEQGVTTIYEIGPGKVLSGLIKKIDKEFEIKNIEKLEDLQNIM